MFSSFGADSVFILSAVIGGGLFLVQLALQFLGGDLDGDFGADGLSDQAFKVLSLQGISAFLLMFGLSALALTRGFDTTVHLAVIGGLAGGVATTWVIAQLFKLFVRLQSNGSLDIRTAVGAMGTVYLTIKENKPGKVTLVVNNRQITRDAITEHGETLETGTPIFVHHIDEDGLLIVASLSLESSHYASEFLENFPCQE